MNPIYFVSLVCLITTVSSAPPTTIKPVVVPKSGGAIPPPAGPVLKPKMGAIPPPAGPPLPTPKLLSKDFEEGGGKCPEFKPAANIDQAWVNTLLHTP